MASWTNLLIEDGFSSPQYTAISALLSASTVSLAYLLFLALRAIISSGIVAAARKNSPYLDELSSSDVDAARENLIDAIVRGGQSVFNAVALVAVALWDTVADPVFVVRTGVLATAAVVFDLYGNSIVFGFIQMWNNFLGPAIGIARRFFAMLAPLLGALSAVYNTLFGIVGDIAVRLTDISGECFGAYLVPVVKGATEMIGNLALALGAVTVNAFGTPLNIVPAVQSAQAALAGVANMLTCTCFLAAPVVVALLGPLQTPQVAWMAGNATLAVTMPFQATGRAIFYSERPDYNPSFYAAQHSVMHAADMANDYINRFAALALTGQVPAYSEAPTNLGIPTTSSGAPQYAPFPDRAFGYVPGFTLVPTTPWFTGVAVSGHFMQTASFVVCAATEGMRMAVNLLVNLDRLWSTTAPLAEKRALFNPDRVEWFLNNGTLAITNGTLFLLAPTHIPEITVLPVVFYDWTVFWSGLWFGSYRFIVDIAFGVADSVVTDSPMLLAAAFWRTYALFNEYAIDRALQLSGSLSVVLGAPRSTAGALTYHTLASLIQAVNCTSALVAGTLLYTAPVSTRIALGAPGPSTAQLRSVFQPMFVELALASEELRPFAAIFPIDSVFNERCDSIAGSGAMFMAPQPTEWWQARQCMATRSCQTGRCPYEMAQMASAREAPGGALCRRTGCDPLGSFDANAPDQCGACPPGCVYSCQLASICALSRCFYTQVSLTNVLCNVDSMLPDFTTGLVGLVQGAVDYVVDGIISSVDEGAVSTAVLWPESTVNELVCGIGRLAAHGGVAVTSSFAPPMYVALVNGGFSPARAKQTIFFISEVCTHIANGVAFVAHSMVEVYKYLYDAVVNIFVGSGAFTPSGMESRVAQFIATMQVRPFTMWVKPIDNFLAWVQGLLLSFGDLVSVLVDHVQCGYANAPLSACPQRIFTDLVASIGTVRDLVPAIVNLYYRVVMVCIRLLIAILSFSETTWQYLWNDIMQLLSLFTDLLKLIVRVLQYFVMETSFAKAVYKLIKEFVCDSLLPFINRFISGWNGFLDKVNDVHLGPIHIVKTFGPWYLFRWMNLDNLMLSNVNTPAGLCNAPASEFGVSPPGFSATTCRPGQGACQAAATCIDPDTPGALLKNCGACSGGSGSCNSFTFTCTCGTQYSAPTACVTNGACDGAGALCLALAQVNANPYEVMACSQCRAAAIVPLCINAVGYGQQSVCGCVGSTSPAVRGVAACPSLLAPCPQLRTPGTSCLGVPSNVPFGAASLTDLLVADCSMCVVGDHACAAVGPGGSLQCVCHLSSTQTQNWVTQRSTAPPPWFNPDGGLNFRRRALLEVRDGLEADVSVSLYAMQAAILGGNTDLARNISAEAVDGVRRMLPPLPHPSELVPRKEASQCAADVDCFAVWPRPAACSSAGALAGTVDHGATLCDQCPAGSPGTARPRACVEGTCRCGRAHRWGIGAMVLANRTTATTVFERALATAPPGPCGATLRTVARVLAARGVAPGDAFNEPLENWTPEMGGALNCMEDVFVARSVEAWLGLAGLQPPLISVDNALYAGGQTLGVALAMWDWYGSTHAHSLLAPPPAGGLDAALALTNVTHAPDAAIEAAHFHALMSAHGVDPLYGIAIAQKVQAALAAAVTYLNPGTAVKAFASATQDMVNERDAAGDGHAGTSPRTEEGAALLDDLHTIAQGMNKLWHTTVASREFRAGVVDFVRNLYASREAHTFASSAAYTWARAGLGERLNPRRDNSAHIRRPDAMPTHPRAEAVVRNVRGVPERRTGEAPAWAYANLAQEFERRSASRRRALLSVNSTAVASAAGQRALMSESITYPSVAQCAMLVAMRDAFVDNGVWVWTFFKYQHTLSTERDVAFITAPIGTTPPPVAAPPLRAPEVLDLTVPAYPPLRPVAVLQTWSAEARAGRHGWWSSAAEWIMNGILPLDAAIDGVMRPFYGLTNLEATLRRAVSCPNIRLTTCADSEDLTTVMPAVLLSQVFISAGLMALFHTPGAIASGAMWLFTPLTLLSFTYNVSPLCALTLRVSPCVYTDLLDATAVLMPESISETSTLARITAGNSTVVEQCSRAPWNFTSILDNAGYATVNYPVLAWLASGVTSNTTSSRVYQTLARTDYGAAIRRYTQFRDVGDASLNEGTQLCNAFTVFRPANVFILTATYAGSAVILPIINLCIAAAVASTGIAVRLNGVNRARAQTRAILALVSWTDAVNRKAAPPLPAAEDDEGGSGL